MTIARNDLWESICPSNLFNITLPEPLLSFSATNQILTFFYNCNLTSSSSSLLPPSPAEFLCGQGSSSSISFYVDDSERDSYEHFHRSCGGGGERIQVQVNRSGYEQLRSELTGNFGPRGRWDLGFDVDYDLPKIFCDRCNSRDGLCDNLATPQYPICKRPGSNFFGLARVLVIAFAGASIILVITVIVARRKIPICSSLWNFTNKSDIDIEAFIRNNGIQAPKRYSYSDVKKITNSFKEKLGQGGYGTVYKGKLLDGHLVAVKVLNTTKGNGDEFINEVASISRTCHVNIVTLLGFCLDGPKRALIYEFMLNGSLDRFIYKKDTPKDRQHLTSQELFKIAVGIARGLEYLHRGCNTRILHFDIKPHNILLDENFLPKIADFGLAKLCTTKESIVSMLEARGTMGYIAPEVFCRSIGGVSHKSDVYSYGMMILEMVGGRKNIDAGLSQTSEIYFPHWIYGYVVQGNMEPQLLGLETEQETEIARKMILIGMWCIQTNPFDRPSTSRVIEMLEGSLEVLQVPPKPYTSSPSRPPVDCSSLTLSQDMLT